MTPDAVIVPSMPAVTVWVPPTARAGWMRAILGAVARTGAETRTAGDVLADVVTQLARVLLIAPADHEVSVTAQRVVDAAARDPAAGREFAQRALTVVAPGLAARDGQQHAPVTTCAVTPGTSRNDGLNANVSLWLLVRPALL